jgi:hypothetical protein
MPFVLTNAGIKIKVKFNIKVKITPRISPPSNASGLTEIKDNFMVKVSRVLVPFLAKVTKKLGPGTRSRAKS